MQNAFFLGAAQHGRSSMRSHPRFEIPWESRIGVWSDDARAVLARVPPVAVEPSRKPQSRAVAFRGIPSFAASLLLHGAAFAFLSQLTIAARVEPAAAVESADNTPIYLDLRALKELKILRALPVVKPSGPGGAPGLSGHFTKPTNAPPQASITVHPNLTVIVNPLKPENNRQAIQQTVAPPDLKIKLEQQLPDIVLVDEAAPQKPQVQVDMTLQHPLAPQKTPAAQPAAAPSIEAHAPELALKITSSVQQPKMPVSYFASDSMRPPRDRGAEVGRGDAKNSDAKNSSGDAPGGVVVMSVDPATFSQLATLAQGNRYGALAIAPSKEGPGSPGGKPSGALAIGTNGAGAGGDTSVGVGAGKTGGGGAASQVLEKAGFSAVGGGGTSGGVDANRLLSPVIPAAIYPVIIAPKLRRAPMVIAAGPMGGGGLDVYGALNCGKVYSIFLPMPGKNWVLQYCAHEAAPAAAAAPTPAQAQASIAKPAPSSSGSASTDTTSAGTIRMQPGLVPPSPVEQFDFRRLPVADKDGDKLIIVQATIDKTGAVTNSRVFQGVLPAMDAAAAQAVAKWKFEPATRAGAPIEVDALIGIPARLPQEATAASQGAAKIQIN
jgi:TonB family protein